MRQKGKIQSFYRALMHLIHSLLFPEFCIGCGAYGMTLCSLCFESIRVAETYTCFYCGRIAPLGRLCPSCRNKHKIEILRMTWAVSYKDEMAKELIHEFKYMGVYKAGEILAEMLCRRVGEFISDIDDPIVVPVPLHYQKLKKRGFNQAEYFSLALSKHYDLHGGLALSRVKETETQVGKSKSDREKNLTDAFVCQDIDLIKDRNVILVDDVITTGTTLNECAKALKSAGAKKIYAVAVARG